MMLADKVGRLLQPLPFRINRRIYWTLLIFLILANAVAGDLSIWKALFSTLPWMALFTIRLHDFGRSGWWAVFVMALVVTMQLLVLAVAPDAAKGVFANRPAGTLPAQQLILFEVLMGGALLLFACFTIWLGITPGDPSTNAYGEPVSGWGLAALRSAREDHRRELEKRAQAQAKQDGP